MTKKESIDTNKKDDDKEKDHVPQVGAEGEDQPEESDVSDDARETEGAEGNTYDSNLGQGAETAGEEKEEGTVEKEPKHRKHFREKELESKLYEQHDKYLRLSAEFDNYRKRMLKERIELTQYISADIYTKMLPVIDDFERAMATIRQTDVMDAVRQGVELIYNKFKEHLDQQGIKEIDALNKEFNTDYHDAVSRFPVQDEKLKGKVIDVVEKGYTLNDKVIRYCKVVVGE